ncbi:envoplakin-like [Coregonus clupeaformis]|uniref:envoplakin-like n=1 Tax=Coregonus clupeaformis TaxID=59861 RepID=UPI001BDFF93A|nr:envoplakin-like [Coregonus clupeaformis]
MFSKKKEYDLVKVAQSQANDVAVLVARMQSNADQVEKNVLRSEELMAVDTVNEKKHRPLLHQKKNAEILAEAEGLLKDLFLDVDRAKKLSHPQAGEIESDVRNLHDRWSKDCTMYRDLYEAVQEVELTPRIDWTQVLEEKQKQISAEGYGPNLSDVEKQIASHNILHQEIEAYGSQMKSSSTGSPAKLSTIQRQYTDLLEASLWRHRYLASLYDYMQGCSKELVYLSEYQERILKKDWSDRMLDPPGVRMEYEKFKNNTLLTHESETIQLQMDGDHLLEMKHPASSTIRAHSDALQNEWQSFLNLCICQEVHLDNIDNYRKYQLDVETLSESMKRLNSNLDPKSLDNKSNPEILLQLEGDERAIERNEQRLVALREFSSTIAPLKLRRLRPTKPTPVVSLCEWTNGEDSVSQAEKLMLKSNSDNENWEVQTSTGKTKTLPGTCFLVPPPDTEALEKVESLDRELSNLKRKRTTLMASLRSPSVEVVRSVRAAPVASSPEDPKTTVLASQLDKISKNLDHSEKDILSRLRAPLDRSDPTRDLANRLKEHERATLTVRNLEAEKAAVQRDMEPILAQKHLGPTTSALSLKLSGLNNKFDDTNVLCDLYNKKATASMFLERQINMVDNSVSGFEEQLAEDAAIPDVPNILQTRIQKLQNMRKDVALKQDEMLKLSRDLESTEQLSSSLQKGFHEYCPDIRRQQTEVKHLKNRYANVNSQLQERTFLMQEATNKNQGFQSSVQSLNFFLTNLPNNTIKPSDGLSQINSKQNSQKRVVEDIKRKSDDVGLAVKQSRDLQNVLNEYEGKSDKYRGTLKDVDDEDAKRRHTSSMADAVLKKERALLNLYSEVSAENDQLLNKMGLAKNIIAQNEEKVSQVVVKQQRQLQSQQKDLEETDVLKRELADEITRRSHAENDLATYRKRFISLKSRRGVERMEEKEVVQYYRDPKLESDLVSLKSRIQDETVKRSGTRTDIKVVNENIIRRETELTNVKPRLLTKVLTEFERDPQLDKEATKLRDEMRKLEQEVQVRDTETVHMKTEITVLAQKRPTIKERVVKKEVVRLEKDPEMLKAVLTFQTEISEEGLRSKSLNDEIFRTRSQINTLERVIPTIQPKIVTKVLKRVEQDPKLIDEVKTIHTSLEEENKINSDLMKELTSLQIRYSEVEKLRPKLEVKEIINEIYRVDPETEVELVRLRKELQDSNRNCTDLEKEIDSVMVDLKTLRSQKPKLEYKEVTQEVIKEEKSPEVIREMKRLNDQVSLLRVSYDSTLDLLSRLRKERDEWKVEKSKLETKLVNKELIKYENDPLLEKEADRLRRDVREEIQKRRNVEETVFDLQNKYIMLERQKPEEKIVMQEVVRLEKDPKQILEHEKLNKNLDEEVKSRRKLELEVRQLRALVEEKERNLALMDDRQKKIQVEIELRQIKSRILELENTPQPIAEKIIIEEVLKVERDPKLEKLTSGLRTDMDTEETNISRLERDIRNLKIKLDILRKEKSIEKTVYKEVIRVEKDQNVEAERDHLRELVLQERSSRRDQEDEIQRLNTKVTRLQTTKSSTSHEETSITLNRDSLIREKENLLKTLRTLESEKQDISISFQLQSKLMSERNQINRQRGFKMDSEVQRLEKDILDEKDRIHQKETYIMELQNNLKKEDHSETHTRETNLSTRISILDPETGKDMAPYDAYLEGLIDRNQYIHLQELECDWEEITSMGPDGETSILQDRKSGKQFSVRNALKDGRLTQSDLHRYKEGKMPISEFALLVAGDSKPKPYIGPIATPRTPTKTTAASSLSTMPSSLRSSYSNLTNNRYGSSSNLNTFSGDELFPISGVLDTTTNSRMSVRSALTRNLIDPNTAQKLLEAQAATGGIVDLNRKDKFSVHKAVELGLIDKSHMHLLLNAQKAFTGVEDPVTKERLAVGQAAEKGWIPQDSAVRYMEAQYLTGGLVNPHKAGRISVQDALNTKIIDSTVAKNLQDKSAHTKELIDPITKEKISYKEAMDRCKKDVTTGLLLLPASSSSDSRDAPSYSNYRFSGSYSQV